VFLAKLERTVIARKKDRTVLTAFIRRGFRRFARLLDPELDNRPTNCGKSSSTAVLSWKIATVRLYSAAL